MKNPVLLLTVTMFLGSCENRELNEGEKFRPREVHDNFQNSHFTRVEVDGVEYLMMERDNNSPHEGFGFMAFRANDLLEKQDTALAYLKTMYELQVRMYASTSRRNYDEIKIEAEDIFMSFLKEEEPELNRLESDSLTAVCFSGG